METAEFFVRMVDNPVQIPEGTNKQEKYPWIAVLRSASLFVLCITEIKEVKFKSEFPHRDKGENNKWLFWEQISLSPLSHPRSENM